MKTCHMCGGQYEDNLTTCPICGTIEKQKLGLKLAEDESVESEVEDDSETTSVDEPEEREISYAIEDPYKTEIKVKKTEKEYYDSVDMRKYKNKIQLGYIMIYALVGISTFSTIMLSKSVSQLAALGGNVSPETYATIMNWTAILSALVFVIPTLIVQFCRSRIAAVVLDVLCVLNLLLGYSRGGLFILIGAIYCTIGVFKYKTQWDFYKDH